jgi:reactive intermediate/imine deaminase
MANQRGSPCCGATFYTLEQALTKHPVQTANAPQAIGTYSQAIRAGGTIYLSGQIGLDPATMTVADGAEAQIHQVFRNLQAVAAAAGASLDDAVKLTVFLTDLAHFAKLNEIMSRYLKQPYPARSAVGVAQLPRGALVEIEAVLVKDFSTSRDSGLRP